MRWWLLTSVVALASLSSVRSAPVPAGPPETPVTDASDLLPTRKFLAHAGTVVGVVASDVVAAQGREGRSGPPDAMGFSVSGSSYNWMYTVSDAAHPLITGLQVKVGPRGEELVTFPKLDMARPKTLAAWNIESAYFLAEIEVNHGKGSPANEAFVATKIVRLDDSKNYPLQLTTVVKTAQARFSKDADKALDTDTWDKARKDALGDQKATGPKETKDVFYVTYLPEAKRVRVVFLRTVTDGDYKFGGGGANLDPPALPVLDPPPPGAKPGVRPPPAENPGVRWGVQFGVEIVRAYEFNLAGDLVGIKTVKPKTLKAELPPPPSGPRGGFPMPAPLPVLPKKR